MKEYEVIDLLENYGWKEENKNYNSYIKYLNASKDCWIEVFCDGDESLEINFAFGKNFVSTSTSMRGLYLKKEGKDVILYNEDEGWVEIVLN